jgi:hypothetical protein
MLGSGCWIKKGAGLRVAVKVVSGYLLFAAGGWMLGSRYWILDTGFWIKKVRGSGFKVIGSFVDDWIFVADHPIYPACRGVAFAKTGALSGGDT